MISRRRALAAPACLFAATALPFNRARGQDASMPAKGKRDWAAQVGTVRIGLLGGENESDRLGRFGPYGRLMEETFQVSVRLFPAADYAGVIQAFGAKQIELSSMGSSGYAGAWIETSGNVEPLLVPIEADGSISYISVMVVRADSGITNLEQMKGHSLAFADPNSTSGYLIPSFELRQSGIDTQPGRYFSRTGFGGGHEQAVVAVLQKQYDACCTWASGLGDESQGFTRGNLREMVNKDMLRMSDLRIIWKSRPILNGPLTARSDTPQAFRDDMIAFHMALPVAHPEIYEQIERGGGKGYRKVTHEQFQLFVDLRREEAKLRRQRG